MEHGKELESIDDSEEPMQLDTDKLNKIMESVEAIHADVQNMQVEMKSIRDDMTAGDTATRAYVDKNINAVRKDFGEDMKEVVTLFKSEVRAVVDSVVSKLLAPIISDMSKFTEKSVNNEKEIDENNKRIDKLFDYNDQLAKQFTSEVETRLINANEIVIALHDNGRTLSELLALSKEQVKINEIVKQHDKVFQFVKGINWAFVLKGVSIIAPSVGVLLKVFNLV